MNRNKIITMMFIFIVTIVVLASFSCVQANPIGDSVTSAQDFANQEKSNVINYQNLYIVANFLYNAIMMIAIVVAVIVGMIIGMRIILGSLEEKADAKALLVPYFTIVTMVALGLTAWKVIMGAIYGRI